MPWNKRFGGAMFFFLLLMVLVTVGGLGLAFGTLQSEIAGDANPPKIFRRPMISVPLGVLIFLIGWGAIMLLG